ncbi:DUF429 domain-containing protein [Sinorhizobium medicae]|uniref:DUF429 domain-containing protein n=1 Tax=Sinorhizobium medicae TaxID=110321 RepID=UPI000485301F|nr:DUF429 domain-containing protein [Sinorhizobium medicae]MDX0695434.1 DUF429 domain-containing protein [Sinorhizobium medicae]MDX0744956.1 DUF429 domain-containing protein [Sinorhizobium medicae]
MISKSACGELALLGIDVGYARSRPTTGIAWSAKGDFWTAKTHTDWGRRQKHLPAVDQFAVIAIDGPLVPIGSSDSLVRFCERLFTKGLFQRRCKPGPSHVRGSGQALRRAAAETAGQVLHLAMPAEDRTIFPERAIVEAFPNAFLGVMLDDEVYLASKAAKRKKFDWLYERAIEVGVLDKLLDAIGCQNLQLRNAIRNETDHEKRAALICLLTAACAATERTEVVGDEAGGWFWLPPQVMWASWASEALEQNKAKLRGELENAS